MYNVFFCLCLTIYMVGREHCTRHTAQCTDTPHQYMLMQNNAFQYGSEESFHGGKLTRIKKHRIADKYMMKALIRKCSFRLIFDIYLPLKMTKVSSHISDEWHYCPEIFSTFIKVIVRLGALWKWYALQRKRDDNVKIQSSHI